MVFTAICHYKINHEEITVLTATAAGEYIQQLFSCINLVKLQPTEIHFRLLSAVIEKYEGTTFGKPGMYLEALSWAPVVKKKKKKKNLCIIIMMTQSASKSVRDTVEQACFHHLFKIRALNALATELK